MQVKSVILCLVLVILNVCRTVHGLAKVESSLSSFCDSPAEQCLLRVQCTSEPRARRHLVPCLTADGLEGLCCNPSLQVSQRKKRSLPYEFPTELYENAIEEGHRVYSRKLEQIDRNREHMVAGTDGADSLFRRFHSFPSVGKAVTAEQEAGAYEDVFVARSFADALNLTDAERVEFGFEAPKRLVKRCVPPKPCNPHARYRTIDGSCNNPLESRSSLGKAGYPFERLLPPAYEDGVWAPRLHSSVSGRPLASARAVSVAVLPDNDRPDHRFNLLLMQFGQFMAHDFTRSASIRMGKDEIQCCNADHSGPLHGESAHFACLPIDVSPNDPFFSKFGIRCLNFVRLALARDGKCKLGYGKQVNRVTHFIDGSTVYGSDDETAASVRTFSGGRLRNSFPSGVELLPFLEDRSACEPWAKACFKSGDDRTNQLVSLTLVHTMFLREHNRVAARLEALNRHWDDETLYQETRRIVVAELQKIFYNEYLPAVLGLSKARQYGLLDDLQGHTNFYSPDVRPIVFNELTGAAYRFGHSTVDGTFLIQHRHRRSELVPLHNVFLDPSRLLEPSFYDDMLFSIVDQPQQQVDDSITFELTRMLFAGRLPFGTDLAALNIQRGRDHALRPYNDYREWAGLSRVTSFEQFGPFGAKLASVYDSPDDVDLWVGGILEPLASDALFGETFASIIGEQFARLKFGDRYYYTNGPKHNPGFFSSEQLAELANLSFASVVCANLDRPQGYSVPLNVFQQPSEHNPPVPCSSLPPFDLTAWSDR
ncbi:chorion peroxidase [Anopheles ziemanni]|uniref:chorion peroxidase n=1 Tax=Anopheles coustani TaxID=139045 RepID=UPI00265A9458|nr:chorion peroxidase [Anopheles coustani]XP_058174851.1 chorion peroxidase [Anopheles ziemanni]